ncbi:MAG: NADH-quinone oxidoreductase subunit NuoB [Elusimicrobiota bacterium]
MLKMLIARIKQGYKTVPFPKKEPNLSERYMGIPVINQSKCEKEKCAKCVDICPVSAFKIGKNGLEMDLGKCMFCGACARVCPKGVISFSKDYRMAVTNKSDLICNSKNKELKLAKALNKEMLRVFGRSINLRQVSAGGCNACESDVNVLTTIVFDLSRFGINFSASPRHTDGLLITGPVTKNMELALRKTYDAIPEPKIVIAVGACAISGGIFCGHNETYNGAADILPVDLYIPGCPPHPITILDGLLRLLNRL